VFGNFVVGDLSLAEFLDLLFSGFDTRLEADPGGDDLAEAGIGDADDLRLADLGMGVEELLDLAGIDVFSSANNYICCGR